MLWSRHSGGPAGRLLPGITAAILLLTLTVSATAQVPIVRVVNSTTGQMVEAADGQMLIMPRPGVTAAQMRDMFARLNAKSAKPFAGGGVWVVYLPAGQSVSQALRDYGRQPILAVAEPDVIERPPQTPRVASSAPGVETPKVVPNDPLWDQQWGPQIISCPDAWDFETGDPNLVIGVVDTGVDRTHVDLAGKEWTNAGETPGDGVDNDGNGFVDDVYGWDFGDDDNDPAPDDAGGFPSDHGTHVSGSIAAIADNAEGIAGVTWGGRIMSVRVGGALGWPRSNSFAAITYAVDMGAELINLSIGGGYTASYDAIVDYAYSNGVLLCAAAGNSDTEFTSNPATWFSPVCNDGVAGVDNKILGVAAIDRNQLKASFSNYGAQYWFVDVSAPGTEILSCTWPGNGYVNMQGTSMACPHVTGLAALVMAQIGTGDPGAVIAQIRTTTTDLDTLNPIYAGKLGTGLIDATSAVGYDAPPAPATAVNAFDTTNDEGGSITITWRRSRDDGAGRDDVTGYELWRGVQPDPSGGTFTMIADRSDLPPRSSGWIDTDSVVDGQNYYYFVRTFDAANQVDSSVAGPASPGDDSSPPPIDNLVAQDTQADSGRSITLSWVGYAGAADLTKFRVYRSEAEFTAVTEDGVELVEELSNPNARSYVDKADDPDADPTDPTKDTKPLDLTDYWYAVTALDEVPNEIQAVIAAGPAQSAPNLSISFNLGMRMITIPADPIDPSPMSVFGLTDPSEAEFVRYDTVGNMYRTLASNPNDPFLEIAPGRAYWFDRNVPTFIAVGGHVVEDPETEVSIDQGWNQVGSPYDADYPFEEIDVRDALGTDEDITASNAVRPYGWRYDAFQRSYRLLSPLLPNADIDLPAREGMWVYALDPGVKLVFFNNVAVTAAKTAKPVELDGWQMRIVARAARSADTDNFLGVTSDPDAIGKIVSPPPVGNGVDLFFTSGRAGRVAVDLRNSPKAKWEAVVECTAGDTDVELTWPDLSGVPNDVRPILKDLSTGRSVYMRTASGYTYHSRAVGQKRRFEITLVGPELGPVMTQLAVAPTKAGGVELTYVLNRSATEVRVDVLNVAGRPVATVPTGANEIGLNRVVWSGQAAGGQRAPNGRYMIRVTAVAEDNGETSSALRAVVLQR